MLKPKMHQYTDIYAYLKSVFGLLKNHRDLTKRYDFVCDILRYCKHSYPKTNAEDDKSQKFWQSVHNKMLQFASSGVRAISVLWIHEFGSVPTINPTGQYYSLKIKNRTVLKAMRRRRSECIRAMMRKNIPQDLRLVIIALVGL